MNSDDSNDFQPSKDSCTNLEIPTGHQQNTAILKPGGSSTPANHSKKLSEASTSNIRRSEQHQPTLKDQKQESVTAETHNQRNDEVIHQESAGGLQLESTSLIDKVQPIISEEKKGSFKLDQDSDVEQEGGSLAFVDISQDKIVLQDQNDPSEYSIEDQ